MSKIVLLFVYLSVVIGESSMRLGHLDDLLEEYVENDVTNRAEENSGLFEGDIVIDEEMKRYLIGGAITSRDAIVKPIYYWPQGTVYYMFDENLPNATVQLIKDGIHHLKERTCLKFVEVNRAHLLRRSYVKFFSGNGCYSRIGRNPDNKEQEISIGHGCERIGTVVHEIMHALGFFHEHTRPDRDKYIKIDWNNIQKEHAHNFEKYPRDLGSSFGKPYDYDSLMHYSTMAFCKDCRMPTIEPADEKAKIGQRLGLSYYDREEVNSLYKCEEGCVDLASPYKCIFLSNLGACQSPKWSVALTHYCPKTCNFCDQSKISQRDSKETKTKN